METTTPTPTRKAAVYRLYDAAGTLLYIGSAYDPEQRSRAHRNKPWWAQAVRREDEWYPSRGAAYLAETAALAYGLPPGNRIKGPGEVATPTPKAKPTTLCPATEVFVLEEIGAYFGGLKDEPPVAHFHKLNALMEAVRKAIAAERKALVQQMHESGMTYRQIAAELGISFGRVRQILAEDLDQPSDE